MIIGISGKSGSGKDEFARIFMRLVHNKNVNNNWETKMFAGKLKEILCILFGCTMEQLEDSDFKNSPLPDEFQHLSFGMIRTYRWALTHIGTDMFKEQFDPLIWINALMREYKLGEPFQTGTTPENLVWQEPDFPNWLITDVRFPEEAQAIKDKGGIVLRINRPIKPMIITHYEDYDVLSGNPEAFKISAIPPHISETALDSYEDWDYVIDNDGSLDDFLTKVIEFINSFHSQIFDR